MPKAQLYFLSDQYYRDFPYVFKTKVEIVNEELKIADGLHKNRKQI